MADLFKIIFATLDEKGQTNFTAVETNRYGGFEEWPEGFFDQNVEETRQIIEQGLQKKHRDETSGRR